MKILIMGATGLLDHKVVDLATNSGHEVHATYRRKPYPRGERVKHELTDFNRIKDVVTSLRPEAVIHTAAYTDVDGCEGNPDYAFKANSEATGHIARLSEEMEAYMVYASTDYVFGGEKRNYLEEDESNPRNVYGKSKLEGEMKVADALSAWSIARTSVLYGWNFANKPNFDTWVMDQLRKGNELRIMSNQFNSPTLTNNLAEMIVALVENGEQGIFHTTGRERINRLRFARKIADVSDLDKGLISSITSDELNWTAEGPSDSSLNVSKISTYCSTSKL